MNDLQKCSQCLEVFSEERLPLALSSCPHYICQTCLNEVIGGSFEVVVCGFCSASLKKEHIVPLPAPQEVLLNSSKLISNKEKEALLPSELETEGVLLQSEETADGSIANDGLCRLHNVHMDIICISDRERICPHCALFGNHKDHRFKRIQDFEKETKQKLRIFDQIASEKQKYYQFVVKNPLNSLEQCLRKGKMAIKEQICQKIQCFIQTLRRKEQRMLEELESAYQQLQQHCKRQSYFKKRESLRSKLQKWEDECASTKQMLLSTNTLQKKINSYYNSQLQIVSEGSLYLQELKNATESSNQSLLSKIKEVRVSVDTQMEAVIERCMKVERMSSSNFIVATQFQDFLQESNPFMDCTSSEIDINSLDTVVNNSIEADISSLANSYKATPELTKTIKKPISKQEIKSLKSIEQKEVKPVYRKKTTSPSKLTTKQSRVSEISTVRSPAKILSGTSLKEILPGTEVKSSEVKEPEKIYTQFSKNSLTDFFDISDCNLPNDRVVEYVHRARRIHKIRGLKLSSNHLNSQGFEKMLQFLKGVGNINLANNQINETIFDILLKNRDRVDALKIINLSHNPISFEKKTNAKIEELKRMGIIVIL